LKVELVLIFSIINTRERVLICCNEQEFDFPKSVYKRIDTDVSMCKRQ